MKGVERKGEKAGKKDGKDSREEYQDEEETQKSGDNKKLVHLEWVRSNKRGK
jgi:hypothetical protein